MKVNDNVRNLVIILLLAALVVVLPGGGTGAQVAIQALSLAFLGMIAFIASRLYREHRLALYSLGDRRRAVVYVAVGVATLTFTAYSRLTRTGPGTVVWLVLIVACAWTVFVVFRSARNY